MNNIDRAAEVLADWVLPGVPPEVVAQALADAGLLTPEPQIIRTRDELAALDPDTLVAIPRYYGDCDRPRLAGWVRTFYPLGESSPVFPAVVIATGDHVRAARRALGEA